MNAGAKDIETDDLERCVAANDLGVDLDDGARHRHLRHPGDAGIDRFGETAARSAHLEVGIAREHLDALRQLVDRGGIDELHRVAQRHAECDRQHREHGADPILRERAAHRGAIRSKAHWIIRVQRRNRGDGITRLHRS